LTDANIYFSCIIKNGTRKETVDKLMQLTESYTDHIEQGQDIDLLSMDLKAPVTSVGYILNVLEESLDTKIYSEDKLMYIGHIAYGPWTRGLYISKGKLVQLTGAEFIKATDKEEHEKGEI
jgi:hypothetical protein